MEIIQSSIRQCTRTDVKPQLGISDGCHALCEQREITGNGDDLNSLLPLKNSQLFMLETRDYKTDGAESSSGSNIDCHNIPSYRHNVNPDENIHREFSKKVINKNDPHRVADMINSSKIKEVKEDVVEGMKMVVKDFNDFHKKFYYTVDKMVKSATRKNVSRKDEKKAEVVVDKEASNNTNCDNKRIPPSTSKKKNVLKEVIDDFQCGDKKILRAIARTATVNLTVLTTHLIGGGVVGVMGGLLAGGTITAKRLGEGIAEEDEKEVAKSIAVYSSATTASITGQAITGAILLGVGGVALPVVAAVAFGVGCVSGISAGALSEWGVDNVLEDDKNDNNNQKESRKENNNTQSYVVLEDEVFFHEKNHNKNQVKCSPEDEEWENNISISYDKAIEGNGKGSRKILQISNNHHCN